MRPEEFAKILDTDYGDGLRDAGRRALTAWLRVRDERDEAEGKLAGIADTLNQELRENGGDRFQTDPTQNMRLAIQRLVDCVNVRAGAAAEER